MFSPHFSSLCRLSALVTLAFVSTHAFADDRPTVHPAPVVPNQLLKSLSVDLDGDGRPDTVEIRSLDQKFSRLVVRLSASGKELTFDRLVRTQWGQLYADGNIGGDTEVGYCESVTDNELALGKKAGTFVLTEAYSDYEGCAGDGVRELTIALSRGKLIVTTARSDMNSYSMGDPSPITHLIADFQSRTAYASSADHHDQQGKKPDRAAADMPASCTNIALEEFEHAQLPACAAAAIEKVSEKVSASCGRVSDFDDVCWPKNKE